MPKANTIDKNPLSVALGYYLSRERRLLPKEIGNKSKDVAKAIGIGESLYRMIESGNARIHPKSILKYVSVFNTSGIKFETLCKVLVGIHYLDAYLDNPQTFYKAVEELKRIDDQFQALFESMKPVFEAIEKSIPNLKPLIEKEDIYNEIRKLLTENEYYGMTSEQIQEEQIIQIYNKVPTFYSGFAKDILSKIFSLPLTIRFTKLWQWEDENSDRFTLMYSIVKNHENVTSYENLYRYTYKYLWNTEFKRFHFIFLDCTKSQVETQFKANLSKVYREKGFARHDTRFKNFQPGEIKFNEIIDTKVEFNTITTKQLKQYLSQINESSNERFEYPLTAQIEETDDEGNIVKKAKELDAAWVYEMDDNNDVGFWATINQKEKKLVEAVNHYPQEARQFKKLFKLLLEKIHNHEI